MFSGAIDGIYDVFNDFTEVLSDEFSGLFSVLVDGLSFLIIIVGIWFGLRAIIRAVRTIK